MTQGSVDEVRSERRGNVFSAQCPCRELLDIVASKWSVMVIEALCDAPQRFGALRRRLDGVSPMVLTSTLRRLEDAGLLMRTVYPQVPLRVEYALTDDGRSAVVPLRGIRWWAESHYGMALDVARRNRSLPN